MEDSKVETVTEEIATTVYQFRKRKLNNSSAVMEGKRFQHKVYYRQKSTISYSSVHSNNEDVKIKEPSTKRTLLSIETEEMARPQSSTPKKEVFVHKDVLWQRKWLSFNKHHLPPKYGMKYLFCRSNTHLISRKLQSGVLQHSLRRRKQDFTSLSIRKRRRSQMDPKTSKTGERTLRTECRCRVSSGTCFKSLITHNKKEVDHYEQLCDGLSGYGYTGVYKQRTGSFRDGCAIFWKQERYVLSTFSSFSQHIADSI
jgi:hypothetical protein